MTTIAPELLEANAKLIEKRKQVRITIGTPVKISQAIGEQCDEVIGENLLRMANEAREFTAKVELYVGCNARKVVCEFHGALREPDLLASVKRSRESGKLTVVYSECPGCKLERTGPDSWLHRAGVPRELLAATLENWKPRTEADQNNLKSVRRFAQRRTGIIFLLGPSGLGKTHLAVGVMALWRCGWLITQRELLSKMRRHDYNRENVENVVEKAKTTPLLVLDEIGLSVGGKDELPMLHDILDHRHGEFLPTMLTGNVEAKDIPGIIGGRMMDRLAQSGMGMLKFDGSSMRPALKYGQIAR